MPDPFHNAVLTPRFFFPLSADVASSPRDRPWRPWKILRRTPLYGGEFSGCTYVCVYGLRYKVAAKV